MRQKHIISISEARKRIFEIAEEIQKPDTYFTLTEKGKAKAVIMSAEEFDSWQETVEIVGERSLNVQYIKSERQQYESNKTKYYPTLDEVLEKQGYIVAEKVTKLYEPRNTIQPSSKKRSRRRPASR